MSTKNIVTLLTATGERHKTWPICEVLMMRQTYLGPVQWIIVDDGNVEQEVKFKRENWDIKIIRPFPRWNGESNTQARNLLEGIDVINRDSRVFIIEDDDWYSKDYVKSVNSMLDLYDMAGQIPSRYFNINTNNGKVFNNYKHSSLCSTALKGKALDAFICEAKKQHKFIDIALWKNFIGSKVLYDKCMVVGMKGFPGRAGIGSGHDNNFGRKTDLKTWIGKDVEIYSCLFDMDKRYAA